MEFRMLGPLEVEDEGRTIPLAGAKQRALLALLLLARGKPVATDRLIEEIWNGEPPADLQLEPWTRAEIRRLEERRSAALEARIDADLALGCDRELVAEVQALVQAQPFRERLLEQLMLALYRSGRQADALDAYR